MGIEAQLPTGTRLSKGFLIPKRQPHALFDGYRWEVGKSTDTWLGGGFNPYLGKIPNLTNIFQMG